MKVKRKCRNLVIESTPEFSKEEIINFIFSEEPNQFNAEFYFNLSMIESEMLFEKVAKKFGTKLWKGHAWENKTCRRNCPFGCICKKYCIKIENDIFCYGQLYDQKINEDTIYNMAETKQIYLLNSNRKVIVYLNKSTTFEKEIFSNYFFDYGMFIVEFGDYGDKHKINGEKFILLL